MEGYTSFRTYCDNYDYRRIAQLDIGSYEESVLLKQIEGFKGTRLATIFFRVRSLKQYRNYPETYSLLLVIITDKFHISRLPYRKSATRSVTVGSYLRDNVEDGRIEYVTELLFNALSERNNIKKSLLTWHMTYRAYRSYQSNLLTSRCRDIINQWTPSNIRTYLKVMYTCGGKRIRAEFFWKNIYARLVERTLAYDHMFVNFFLQGKLGQTQKSFLADNIVRNLLLYTKEDFRSIIDDGYLNQCLMVKLRSFVAKEISEFPFRKRDRLRLIAEEYIVICIENASNDLSLQK
jgi:hypothetical protein